jgi:protein-disulfide isomerase
MANTLPYVVGVVIAAGAAIAVYEAVDGRSAQSPRPPTVAERPATPASGATASVAAPKAEAHFDKPKITADDYVLGKADAPVTVVEYASMTCPHCARMSNNVLSKFEKEFVDTGKARYVYRDFPLDQIAVRASVLARCNGRDRYFPFVKALFADQDNWVRSSDPVKALEQVGRLGGVSPEKFDSCLKNQALVDKVLQSRLDAQKEYRIDSTPTFLVNGDKYSGEMSYEQFKAIVVAHMPKG